MTNTKNLANLAAALDDGTSGQVLQSTGSGGVQFADSSGSGVTVHANQAAMLTDAASASEGSLHYENNTNKLYVKQSSGFYLLASITNASPTIDSFSENTGGAGANNLTTGGTFTLTAGSNTVVTINATEPDLETISYSATVTSGTATDVFSSPSFPVTNQSSNVFTLTPVTSGTGGTVTIRFDASDGTNVANVSHSFEIAFVISDSKYTTLLMATDGSAGDNNDITDSSTNNHTITVNGDAHAGTFSPYRHGGYSTYFDGSGDFLTAGSSGIINFGTGDFTVEFWINTTAGTGAGAVNILNPSTSTGSGYWGILLQNNKLRWNNSYNVSNLWEVDVSNELDGSWHHMSIVRSSGTFSVYVDGTSKSAASGTFTDSTNYSGDEAIRIGEGNASDFTGYLSDVRIVKGTAITPPSGGPTERLTDVSGTGYSTSLLTCHLPYIADGSSNAYAITVNGNTSTKPFGPYDYEEYSESINGGSVYFDGSGDYLTISNDTSINLANTSFTIECWVFPMLDYSSFRTLFTKRVSGNPTTSYQGYLSNSTGYIGFYNGTAYQSSTTLVSNAWSHCAWVYDGTNIKIFVNGTQVLSQTTSVSEVDEPLSIGFARGYTDIFGGYISDFRIVKGTAVYSGAFTPPSGPLTTTGGTYPSTTNVDTSITASNTSLLLSGTDAHVLDKSQGSNLKLEGSTAASTTQTKFSNTASVYFDGTGDYVTIPNFEDIGSGNFTIEMFIYQTASGSYSTLFSTVANYATSNGLRISTGNNNNTLQVASAGSALINASSAFNNSTWNHVALVRSGTTLTLYLNGSSVGSATNSQSFVSDTFYIGDVTGTGSPYTFTGYIQDLRVTIGKARTISVPSAPLKG